MRTLIIGSLVFAAYLVPARWYYICKVKGMCDDGKTENVIAATGNENDKETLELPPRTSDLSLTLDDKEILKGFEQFGFMPNSGSAVMSESNEAFIDSIANYMKANPDTRLGLTGYYFPDEKLKEAGIYDNVGIARAASIRDLLVAKGLDSERFKLDYQEAVGDGPFIAKPLNFSAFMPEETDEEFAESKYDEFKEMTFGDLNFEKNSEVFAPTEAFNNYALRLKKHLDAHSDKTIIVEGHCDSDGSEEHNMNLGRRRANTVRAHLVGVGIDGKRIDTESKGESTPTVPNDTRRKYGKKSKICIGY